MSDEVYTSTSVRGLLRIEGDALVLEYRETVNDYGGTGSTGYGTRPGPVQELRLPLERVRSIVARRRYFLVPVCEIHVDRLATFESIDWANGTLLRLRIPFRHFQEARDVAASLSLLQADARLRELGEGDLAG